jgi:hypothetical protein
MSRPSPVPSAGAAARLLGPVAVARRLPPRART